MEELPFVPSDAHLRRRYNALLNGEPVIDAHGCLLASDYERWRELKRLVIVHGLPRDESSSVAASTSVSASENEGKNESPSSEPDGEQTTIADDEPATHPWDGDAAARCSLRGRVWKVFLGVRLDADMTQYAKLVGRGASHCDGDIRNDTFRTFRGDPEFAQRVPEEKLVRLLNVFINELGSNPDEDKRDDEQHEDFKLPYIRYVQGMNILCAPLLYVLPEPDAYHTFCQLIVRHCPQYMAPQLKGVEKGCILVDKCLQTLDPDLFQHLSVRGITARIYALPLILSLFACVPPLHELLRVWDVLFAVGVHFVVILAVAHTVLLREQLLQKDMDLMKVLSLRFAPPLQSDLLISVALQLLHRLPDDLLYEIARHPFASPDAPSSLTLRPETVATILTQLRQPKSQPRTSSRSRRSSTESLVSKDSDASGSERAVRPTQATGTTRPTLCSSGSRSVESTLATGRARPPWKL